MVRYAASSLLAACGLFGLTEQAGAVAIERMLAAADAPQAVGRLAPAFAAGPAIATCDALPSAALAAPASATMVTAAFVPARSPLVPPSAQASKGSAILGGAVSALDRIRLDQAAQAATLPALARSEGGVPGTGLTPGAGPFVPASAVPGTACSGFTLPRTAVPSVPGRRAVIAGGDDFLQTRRLAVSRTAFDGQWARVSRQGVSPQVLARDADLRGLVRGRPDMTTVAAINAWTNRRIRFVDDAKLFGTADYWAPAQTTLKLGAGDCEDIAITKMQLLAAAGVERSDMYLTIARDLARHADHALLVVRIEGRYWLLDNSTDQVLDAQTSYDYQPVLSFSKDRKWLHGAVAAPTY